MKKYLWLGLSIFFIISGTSLYAAHNYTEDSIDGLGADAISNLIDVATSLDPADDEIRIRAIKRLGELKAKESLDVLIEVLQTKRYVAGGKEVYNWRLKVIAAKALADIGDRKALFPLVDMLRADSDNTVKRGAAQALGLMGDVARTRTVLEVMHAELDRTRDNALVSDICESLGKIGDKSSFVYLLRVTQGPYLNYVKEVAQKSIAMTKWDKPSVFEETSSGGSASSESVSKYNK